MNKGRSDEGGSRSSAYLAEGYAPGLTTEGLAEAVARLEEAASQSVATGAPVHHAWTIYLPRDQLVLSLFEGASGEAVARVSERARMPVERISQALLARKEGGRS